MNDETADQFDRRFFLLSIENGDNNMVTENLMSTAAGGLKELHQLQLRLSRIQKQLSLGPQRIENCRKNTTGIENQLEEEKEQLKQLRMLSDQKALQLKTNEQKIEELRVKLHSCTSNREFDIFKSHIEADMMANSVLEDEILEALEKVDRHQTAIQDTEDSLDRAKASEVSTADEVAAEKPSLDEDAAELMSALESAETILPETIIERYRRLVDAHGSEALSAVENKACSTCHSLLSPQYCVDVNTGKFTFCRSCGRLLYLGEEN
jgi:predicted  nucleic acid-binding Zn-ribbon protein